MPCVFFVIMLYIFCWIFPYASGNNTKKSVIEVKCMSSYSRGMITGMVVGAATGMYFLVRSNPILRKRYRMRQQNFRNKAMMFSDTAYNAGSILGRTIRAGSSFAFAKIGSARKKLTAMQ